jgi:hypothetical protein
LCAGKDKYANMFCVIYACLCVTARRQAICERKGQNFDAGIGKMAYSSEIKRFGHFVLTKHRAVVIKKVFVTAQ